jgi:uncharacterized protein YbcI
VRCELLEKGRPLLETVIMNIVGVPVESIHTDISTRTGERIIIFRLKEALPAHLCGPRQPRAALNGRGHRTNGQ